MTPPPFDPEVAADENPRRLPHPPTTVLAVAAGGAVGGCIRYGVDLLLPSGAPAFPWATLTVNVTGSFLLALLLVLILEVWPPSRLLRPFLAVGLLGSLTTFSTWMLEFDQLMYVGATTTAVSYLAGSLVAGVLATSLGLVAGHGMAGRRTRMPSTKKRQQ
jgi:fluoride exporter